MRRFQYLILALLVTLPMCVTAQTVNRIIIKSTTGRPISRELVEANMSLQPGTVFTAQALSEDIKTLYKTKQFDDISASVDRVGETGVDITLLLKPKSRVISIRFVGNKKVKTKKLLKKMKHEEGAVLNERLLKEDLEAFNKLYKEKNYHDAVINQDIQTVPETGDVTVVYTIDESQKVKTRGVEFEGNSLYSDRKLRKKVRTSVSWWGYILPAGYFKQEVLDYDKATLRDLYLDDGYLDFEVVDVQKDIRGKKIFLTFDLAEGEPYTVDSIKVEIAGIPEDGVSHFSAEEVREMLRQTEGVAYGKSRVDGDVARIKTNYNTFGYLDSQVIVQQEPNAAAHTVTLTYQVYQGRWSTIRNINIAGNRVTKDEVIRRELQLHPGDLSDGNKIRQSKNRLENLGYFEVVEVVPVSTAREDEKDLNVHVSEGDTGRLLFGAGLSSADSFFFSAEVAQTNFDLFDWPGFRGDGQRLRLRTQIGTTRQDYAVDFTEPWLFDRPLRLDVSAWRRDTSSNRDWDESSVGLSVAVTRQIKMFKYWRQTFGYRIENITIGDIDDTYSQSFRDFEEGSSLVSALSLSFRRDTRDRVQFTSSGSVLTLSLEGQSQAIGSYTDMLKVRIAGEQYIPVFRNSVVKVSSAVTAIEAVSDEPKIFDRLFAGGLRTVRGFEERGIGPIDPGSGETIGGKSQMINSLEFITPVYEQTVHWVLFADAGNVWADTYDVNPFEMNVGVGTGVRLLLPIGAVSIDYGWPILRDDERLSDKGRLHFTLGYNF